MSKCNRMKKQLTLPAFDIKPIDDHTGVHGFDTPARSAAEAQAISDILPHISLGSWRDAENAEVIKSKGITHVLNVAKECPSLKEQELMDAVEVVKCQIPLVDAHSENILPHFEEAFKFIEQARLQKGRVLVHCRRGISRSPAIVTGYIMSRTGATYESALSFVTGRRSSVSLNLAFREILLVYRPSSVAADIEIREIMGNCPSSLHLLSNTNESPQSTTAPASMSIVTPPVAVSNASSDDAKTTSSSCTMNTVGSTTTMGITPSEESPNGAGSKAGAFGEEDEEDDHPARSGGKDTSSF